MNSDEMMQSADVDHNGLISAQEHLAFAAQQSERRFAQMDVNQDGRLAGNELTAAEERMKANMPNPPKPPANGGQQNGRPPPGPQSMLQRADANQDGAVDRAEHRAMAERQSAMRFRNADKNGDGQIARDEMNAPPPGGSGGAPPARYGTESTGR